MGNFTQAELEELVDLFNFFDTDGSGTISISELFLTLQKMGRNATEAELFGNILDTNFDGIIDFKEFCKIMINIVRGSYDDEQVGLAFKLFDVNGNGQVNDEELHEVSRNLGDELTLAECQEIIREISKAGNSYLTLNDFLYWMKPIEESKDQQSKTR